MQIVISNLNGKYLETITIPCNNSDSIYENFKKSSMFRGPLKANIFAINESVSSLQLSKIKKNSDKINICSLSIYSNNRDTVLAGKSLKIKSNFLKEQEVKNKLLLQSSKNKKDILYEGTVRSGERISSEGNLCIIGDVNPGAIISAKKNIYVWGKLLGIAFAGNGGNNNSSISSLYLNPLQLRIANLIAIGPKEKPKNSYPEIAVVDNQTIIIKPFILDTKN